MTEPAEVETTGRFLVLLQEDAVEEGLAELGEIAGFNPNTGEIGSDTLQVFPELGVAVVSGDPNLLGQLNGAVDGPGAVLIHSPRCSASRRRSAAPDTGSPPRWTDR